MGNDTSIEFFSSKVMNAINALIVVLDLQGNVVFVNAACEHLTGFMLDDVKGKPVWDVFVIAEEVEETKSVFSTLVTFQKDNKHTNFWKTKTGDKKLVSWSNTCLKDDDGKLAYIVATGIDITKQKKDQRTLEEREAKFQSLIKTSPNCIIITDDKGIIEEANPAVQSVFGYKSEELIGQSINILMPEPYRSEHDGYLAKYSETGEKKIIGIGQELMALCKDGSIFPVYLVVSEIWLGNKNFFTGIIRDLTKEKQQEKKLRRAHKVEALGQLTGGIAHDFNNLLTIILGNVEILKAQNLSPDSTEIMNEVFEVINQGSQLVSQLLAFGRRQDLRPEIVDINIIFERLIQLLRRTFREDIEFEKSLGRDIWKMNADPVQIENVLLNIMLNARDAMPDGGKITTKTANVVFNVRNIPDDLQITPGEYVEISVCDTGIGMPDDVLSQVFDPFFTTKGASMGTGLGLSMVHGFVEQTSGGINIESEDGNGTTILIYLPRAEDNDGRINQKGEVANHNHEGFGCKILHVEDDPKVRQVNTRRLISLGYDVLTAKDAPTALKILSKNDDVQIVFSDIVMPGGMTGIELANEVQTRYPKIKVLLTTGYSEEIISGKGENHLILKKPFTKVELIAKIQEISRDSS